MQPDARRTLISLIVAGAVLFVRPTLGYAQGTATAATSPPSVVRQLAPVSGEVGGGSAGGGPTDAQTAFLRGAIAVSSADIAAARLAFERSDDPAVRQFAELVIRQSQAMLDDASDVAASRGLSAPQVPTDADAAALLADLQNRTGQDFDQAYVRSFVMSSRTTLNDYLAAKANGSDDDVSAYADRQLGLVSDQFRAAQELAARLGVKVVEP